MSLKKIKIIGVFGIFAICFISHFMYNWFPNFIFSIFFPINESIWEHIKMICTSILIWQIIEYFLLKKYRINHNNFMANCFSMAILVIPIFLIIYYPIYLLTGSLFFINLLCLFISICLVSIIGYYILSNNSLKYLNYASIIGIIFLYILFGLLTYFPLENNLFLDPLENKYGINTYAI